MSEPNEVQHANADLMRAMGSKNGSDPIPPSQYLAFLTSKDPEQRYIAWVRAHTIRHKHRSPYCTDEHGRALTLTHASADLVWSLSYVSRIHASVQSKGFVRRDDDGKIYLSGDVPPLAEEPVKFCTGNLPKYILLQINKLTPVIRAEFERKYASFSAFADDVEAEAMSEARAKLAPVEAQLFAQFGIERRQHGNGKPKPPKKPKCSVKLTLVAQPDFGVQETEEAAVDSGVQETRESVQSAEAPVYSAPEGAVQETLSIKSSEVDRSSNFSAAAAASAPDEPVAAAAANPAPEADELAPILAAFQPLGGITDEAAAALLKDCKAWTAADQVELATGEEVGAKVSEIPVYPGRKVGPIPVLLREVPKHFRGTSFRLWRMARAEEAEKAAKRAKLDEEDRLENCRRLGLDPETGEPLKEEGAT